MATLIHLVSLNRGIQLCCLKFCEAVVIQSVKHQQEMRGYHARYISSRGFKVGDFILCKIQTTKD
jgi:hypothetical protein